MKNSLHRFKLLISASAIAIMSGPAYATTIVIEHVIPQKIGLAIACIISVAVLFFANKWILTRNNSNAHLCAKHFIILPILQIVFALIIINLVGDYWLSLRKNPYIRHFNLNSKLLLLQFLHFLVLGTVTLMICKYWKIEHKRGLLVAITSFIIFTASERTIAKLDSYLTSKKYADLNYGSAFVIDKR